ncbi:hypothetical protein ACVIHC_005253 [Bradyrhizobium diazoefficiens]
MIGAHGRRAQQQRLVAAATVEDAVGEDVAAFEIGGDLDLVHSEEGDVEISRHRLDGGDPVARVLRLDLLLAGDQRDALHALAIGDLVIDLARQQPQRQADHAGGMREHPLNGEMGLAGVGRPEHRSDARAGCALGGEGGRGKSHSVRLGSADFGECQCCLGRRGGRARLGLGAMRLEVTSPRLRGEVGSRSDPGEGDSPRTSYHLFRGSSPSPQPSPRKNGAREKKKPPEPRATVSLCDAFPCVLKLRNDSRTNRGRIADSLLSPVTFTQHVAAPCV